MRALRRAGDRGALPGQPPPQSRQTSLVIVKGGAGRPCCHGGRSFDLDAVVAIREQRRAPGVGEVEAVEAGFSCAVLPCAGRVHAGTHPEAAVPCRGRSACARVAPCARRGARASEAEPVSRAVRARAEPPRAEASGVPLRSRPPLPRSLPERAPDCCERTRSSSRLAWSCRAMASALQAGAGRDTRRSGARRSGRGATAPRRGR